MFSDALKTNARVLDLTHMVPVGSCQFGQGARRARDGGFFLDFRSHTFTPFGLNYPAELGASATHDISPLEFPATLGIPTNWRWCILPQTDPFGLKYHWSSTGPDLFEDATLKSPMGWLGFESLSLVSIWSVSLGAEWVFIASPQKLPNSPTHAAPLVAWLKVFFSNDILGPQGRFHEWTNYLKSKLPMGIWKGMNWTFPCSDPLKVTQALSLKGIAVDPVENGIRFSFGLSIFPEDIDLVLMHLPKG